MESAPSIPRCIAFDVPEEGVTAPLLALDNEAVLAENSHAAWVLIEDFEDCMGDLTSRDSKDTITSTSPVVDKTAILPSSSSQVERPCTILLSANFLHELEHPQENSKTH
jgi:hypothetical protein